jgi:methylenetetrahydrofolate dehydrogenase (NADP+) / methenyltetrahydrofolate cyclohydrolase
MTAKLIDGKTIAAQRRQILRQQIAERLAAQQAAPGLAVILVGDDAASQIYVRNKRTACAEVGIESTTYHLSAQTSTQELLTLLEQLNTDSRVHGILVQLPLPASIDTQSVIEHISPSKDVDGFHPYNLGRLAQRRPLLRSCTPKGIMTLLAHTEINLEGLDAVIVGQSNIVGRPMALELLAARCTVTICHSRTQQLAEKVRTADILIAAVGVAELIQGNWIKPNAIVIDVGMNRSPHGGLCGDVEFPVALQRASWITPVPGGVGPMTIVSLLENTLQAAQYSQ